MRRKLDAMAKMLHFMAGSGPYPARFRAVPGRSRVGGADEAADQSGTERLSTPSRVISAAESRPVA